MKKIIIISVSILSVVLIGLAVASGPAGDVWHRTPEERVNYMVSKISATLELDEAQQTVLDRIAEETIVEMQQMRRNHDIFRSDFMAMLRKDSVRPEALKDLFDTKKPIWDDLMQMASENIAEFHSVLNPEQRKTLIAEIESHHGRRCRFMK